MNNPLNKKSLMALAISSAIGASPLALAQQSSMLEEIVVTAQKRAESVQDELGHRGADIGADR